MIKIASILVLCLLLAVSMAWAQKEYAPEETSDFNPLFCPDGGLNYNPFLTDVISWTTGTNMPDSVYGSVCGFYNGQLFRSHGRRSNALPYNTAACWAYNPGSNTWTGMATAPTARRMVAAGMMQDGQYLYSIGGRFDATTTVGTNERYNMATNTWETLAPCTPRWAHGGAVVGGYAYVFGGPDATTNLSCQKYDPATNTWTAAANLPAARGWTCGASLNGKVYCIGGSAANTLYEYDPALNAWTVKAPMPGVKTYCWAVGVDIANKIYVFGGTAATAPTTDVWVWDGATNTWSTDTPMPGPRNWAGVGSDLVNNTFVLGGFDGTAVYYFNTWVGGMDWANPLSPAAPTGFTVNHNQLQLIASLAWTNPTTTVNGQPLITIDSIVVKRNNVQIAALTGTPGQVMSYNDNVPSIGQYNYQVIAVNNVGPGAPASGSSWIGLDVPGAPTGVVATPGNLAYTLNWTAPTAGLHNGYWPPGSWTGQKIYVNGNLVATLTGTNTSYNGTVPSAGNYTIGVAYYNSSGDGPTTNAAPLFISGPPQYTMSSVPYNWVEINPAHAGALPGTNTGITSDDQNVGPFNLGFTFPFFSGTTFTTIRVCSNGFASFTSTVATYTNVAIPNAAEPNNMVAPYWDDMYVPSPGYGSVWYYYDAPNNRFIVEWDSCAHISYYTSAFTYEAILYQNGTMDFMYKLINFGAMPPPASATVGIEDASGVLGMQATFNGSGPLEPASLTGIRFAPISGADLAVTMTPINPPILIPANGGQFNFNATVQRNVGPAVPFWAWARDRNPDGTYSGILLGPVNINPPVGVTVTRQRTQVVAASWQTGIHYYIGYAHTAVSYPATDADSFGWRKLATADGGPFVLEAANYGEEFPYLVGGSSTPPTSFALIGAYPNPFNPSTAISYQLSANSFVSLKVYDTAGRLVATLVNGMREVGSHQVTFDGSNLASGVYLYSLTAGSHNASGKMVLLK